MASFKMSIPHGLTKEEALARIKQLLGKLQQEQKNIVSNVQEKWTGDTGAFKFTAKGYDLAGNIRVQDSNILLDATIPFAVSLFQGSIKKLISSKSQELLS